MSDLKSFYEAGYTQEDPARAAQLGRWRAQGAAIKAEHIQRLLTRARWSPRSIVEIGCGDGALLSAMSARGLAARYDGFELSEPAARLAKERKVPDVVRVEAFDGRRVPAGDRTYDLAVLSHVLEHVPEPEALLREGGRVASRVLVEVPLEANRSAARPGKRGEAREIGHIQAFSRTDVHRLAHAAGLIVLAELSDPLPLRHHAFFAGSPAGQAKAAVKWAVRGATWALAQRRAEQLFTVHYAALLGR